MAKIINIFGFIGSEWDGTTVKQVSDQLDEITDNEVTVRISSGGGYVSDGLAIFNLLRNSKKDVRVEIIGQAYSIASVIAMAGNKVYIAQFADMMLHPAWTFTEGNADDLRKTADELDAISKEIFNTYLTRSKVKDNEDTIQKYFDDETYIKAAECVELGLCDGILEEQASVRHLTRYAAVASFNPNKTKMNENKTLLDEVKALFTALIKPKAEEVTDDKDARIAELEAELAELKTAKETTETELETSKAEAVEAKAKVDEVVAKASELQTKFAELEAKVIGAGGNPEKEKQEEKPEPKPETMAQRMKRLDAENRKKYNTLN